MTSYSSFPHVVYRFWVALCPNGIVKKSFYYFLVNIKLQQKLCLNTNRLYTKARIYFYVYKKEVVGHRKIGRNTAQHTTHIHFIPHTLYAAPNLNHYIKELLFIFNHCLSHSLHNNVVQKNALFVA